LRRPGGGDARAMPNPCLSTPSRRSEGDLNKSINTHIEREKLIPGVGAD